MSKGNDSYVRVDKDKLKAYGYKGNKEEFLAVKQGEDEFSGIYNLVNKEDIVYDVLEEDLKEVRGETNV